MYPIIMAGGSGTRLWPVSRKNKPKQVRPFIDGDTLLQKTYKRLLRGFIDEKIYITTSPQLKNSILEQLPSFNEGNFSIEPCRKGTASALGLVLIKIYKRDKDANFVFINSDSFIKNENAFIEKLNLAEKILDKNPEKIILLGIKPTYPETGYGYIKIGECVEDNLFKVEKFIEKPNIVTAKSFLDSGDYLWNPTLIMSKVSYFLNLFKKHLPDTYNYLMEIEKYIDTPLEEKMIMENFLHTTDISVDYGILEKEIDMLVMPADIGWSDIGHWRAIKDILSDGEENIIKGKSINIDSYNNLIYSTSQKLIGTIGLKDMIIVETEDALLICPKDRAQEVKEIVSNIKEQGLENFL